MRGRRRGVFRDLCRGRKTRKRSKVKKAEAAPH